MEEISRTIGKSRASQQPPPGLREQTNGAGNGLGLERVTGHLTLRQKRVIAGRFVKTGRLKGVQRGSMVPVYRAGVYAGYAAGGGDAARATDRRGRGGGGRRRGGDLVAQVGCRSR